MKPQLEDRAYYFLDSCACAIAKTGWYAFTFSSSIRKVIEKDDSYKSHRVTLNEMIDERREDPVLKNYVELGDKIGFIAGNFAVITYGYFAAKYANQGSPEMAQVFMFSNLISFGHETFRLGWKLGEKTTRRFTKGKRKK